MNRKRLINDIQRRICASQLTNQPVRVIIYSLNTNGNSSTDAFIQEAMEFIDKHPNIKLENVYYDNDIDDYDKVRRNFPISDDTFCETEYEVVIIDTLSSIGHKLSTYLSFLKRIEDTALVFELSNERLVDFVRENEEFMRFFVDTA